jgi:hypothetical protein
MIEPLTTEPGEKADIAPRIPHLVTRRPIHLDGSDPATYAPGELFCSTQEAKHPDHSKSQSQSQSRNRRGSDTLGDPVPNPYIEVLLVVDHKLYRTFNRNETTLEQYVLLMMNIVSLLYSDESHGVGVALTVVHMTILKDAESGLDVSNVIEEAHGNFCMWQSIPNNDRPRYDVAVLLTG